MEFPRLNYNTAAINEVENIVKSGTNFSDISGQISYIAKQYPEVPPAEISTMFVFFIKKHHPSQPTNKILAEGLYSDNIKQLQTKAMYQIENKKALDTIEKEYTAACAVLTPPRHSEYSIDTSYSSIDLTDSITSVELFDKCTTSEKIPFVMLRWKGTELFKICDRFTLDAALLQRSEFYDEKAVLIFVINNTFKSKNKFYTYGVLIGTKLIFNFKTKGGYTQNSIFDMINSHFGGVLSRDKLVNEKTDGVITFYNALFNKTLFTDFIFNHPYLSQTLFYMENKNSVVTKKRYYAYLINDIGAELNIQNAITCTITQVYGDIEVRFKEITSEENLNRAIELFTKIISIYLSKKDEIEKEYAALLGGLTPSEYLEKADVYTHENMKEGERLQQIKRVMSENDGRTFNDLFDVSDKKTKGWVKECATEKQPYILTDDNKAAFLKAVERYTAELQKEGKTKNEIEKITETLSREWEGYDFACIPHKNDDSQFVSVRFLKTGEPCCSTPDVAMKDVKEVNKKQVNQIITSNKYLDFGKRGLVKAYQINRILHLLTLNHNKYFRYNLGNTADTFLRCILFVTNPDFRKYDEQNFEKYLSEEKEKLSIDENQYISPYDYSTEFSTRYTIDEEFSTSSLSDSSSVTSGTFNVCMFNCASDNLSCDIVVPANAFRFNVARPSIIIFNKKGFGDIPTISEVLVYDTDPLIAPRHPLNKFLAKIYRTGFEKRTVFGKNFV